MQARGFSPVAKAAPAWSLDSDHPAFSTTKSVSSTASPRPSETASSQESSCGVSIFQTPYLDTDGDVFVEALLEVHRRIFGHECSDEELVEDVLEALAPNLQQICDDRMLVLCFQKIVAYLGSNDGNVSSIVDAVQKWGCLNMARTPGGAKVLHALVQCCGPDMLDMSEELADNAATLCKCQHSHSVVLALIEYGPMHLQHKIAADLLPGICLLTVHRRASHVVQMLLLKGNMNIQRAILEAWLSSAKPPLAEIASSRFGSFVVVSARDVTFPGSSALLQELRKRLVAANKSVSTTTWMRKVADAWKL